MEEMLRTSFWFVPPLMALGAMVLAYGTTTLDEQFRAERLANISWVYSASAEGARSLLSTITSSMLTVAGITFCSPSRP
jgi:uncharacterized membrane protein